MIRMVVLQHVEFEGPAAIADWAADRGVPVRVCHLGHNGILPSIYDFDMLTVMGGPMSANDQAQLDWLGPEIALVREAIASGQDRVRSLPRRSDDRQGYGRAGLSGKCERDRLVSRRADGRTSSFRWLARPLYAPSLAWRDIRSATRSEAARQEQDHGKSGFCSGSARARTTVSHGGDRGQRAGAGEGRCPRNRLRDFRTAARDNSREPRPMREAAPS